MKILVQDLKKAISWIEANTMEMQISVEPSHDGRSLSLSGKDKFEVQFQIKLYLEGSRQPRIVKEDTL